MKNDKFVYDEKTSALYGPDGTFLKRCYCPKAKHWNQLLISPGETRWRKCDECKEKVVDLDNVSYQQAVQLFKSNWHRTCVHVSENQENVIFLKDESAIVSLKSVVGDPISIQTVRGKADILRGYAMGYWPDVRVIKADPRMNNKISIGQNPDTGEVAFTHDLRVTFGDSEDDDAEFYGKGFREIFPFISYYPYHERVPVGAYLVPKGLPDGTRIVVDDPIENIAGRIWNQGGGNKASNIPGRIEKNRVVLEIDKVKISHIVG